MFLQTQRMTGQGSKITVIEPSHYLEFFITLKVNENMDPQFKAFLAIAVSGGCRVTEALSLRVGNIDPEGHYRVKVLKKRLKKGMEKVEVYRSCMLCPTALEIVQAYTRGMNQFDLLFTMHRSTIHRHIKKHFGSHASSHSIARHSHISWLLHSQGLSTAMVAVEMEMLSHVVDMYNHANIEVEQANRFRKAV